MSTLILVSVSLFCFGLAGWTMATYLVKDDSKKFIQEELINLLDLGKRFFVSLKSLIEVLIKYSFSSDPIEEITAESSELKEQSLKIVDPIEAVESTGTIPSMKMVEEDTELSSFSPELVEVITEEEEKVA